jgi:hypothetical protein
VLEVCGLRVRGGHAENGEISNWNWYKQVSAPVQPTQAW